jgi:hypothetical protein
MRRVRLIKELEHGEVLHGAEGADDVAHPVVGI